MALTQLLCSVPLPKSSVVTVCQAKWRMERICAQLNRAIQLVRYSLCGSWKRGTLWGSSLHFTVGNLFRAASTLDSIRLKADQSSRSITEVWLIWRTLPSYFWGQIVELSIFQWESHAHVGTDVPRQTKQSFWLQTNLWRCTCPFSGWSASKVSKPTREPIFSVAGWSSLCGTNPRTNHHPWVPYNRTCI